MEPNKPQGVRIMIRPTKPVFTTRPVISGTFGVVATTHWLGSQSGMSILEKDGNAFDAAVAASFVLQVVEPQMFGLFGDSVTLFQTKGRIPQVICGQGVAPAGASIEHYRREGLALVPFDGLLAAVVPGAFDAAMVMLRDHGTIGLAEALEPAIGYAQNGYPVIHSVAATIAGAEALFRDEWKSSAAIYLPGGRAPQPGEILANRDLAATYMRLIQEANDGGGSRERRIEAARAAFYNGFIAEAVEKFSLHTEVLDVTGARRKGVLCANDFATWQARYEVPVAYEYNGLTVCKAGPWSQGPVLLQILALLKGFDVGGTDVEGPDFIHTFVEAMKLAFADRDAWYGDPNFVDVPLQTLLSESYNGMRRKLISERASFEIQPGSPDGRPPTLPALATANSQVAHQVAVGDTCHIDVIDCHGNVVAVTPSGGFLQCSPVIPSLGSGLGNRAQSFWLQEGLAASLAPGRRPRTTLSPTLALRSGEAVLACGSPGADSQEQWIAQFLLRHVEHKLNLQAAIDAPSIQTEHLFKSIYPRESIPGKVVLENRFPEATITELNRRGHNLRLSGAWSSANRVCAAARDGKLLHAAATPRLQQAYAVGR
jgi:gamma-glutamyltranspeptidase/glutathione hydrolase